MRCRTWAAGSPSTTESSVPAAAVTSVNSTTRWVRSRVSTSSAPTGLASSLPRPSDTIAATGTTKNATMASTGTTASAARPSRRRVIVRVSRSRGRATPRARRRAPRRPASGSSAYGSDGLLGVTGPGVGERHPVADREDVHRVRQRRLDVLGQQELDELAAALGVGRAGEHAGVLDLAVAGVEQRPRWSTRPSPSATVNAGEES